MNPHQQNKLDVKSLSPDEQRLLRMYGKIPNKKDLLQNKLKERKYFDSGDYALSKAGKAADVGVTNIGSRHPVPENIPHLTATSPPQGNHFNGGHGGSPHPGVPHNGFGFGAGRPGPGKEGSFLRRSSAEGKEFTPPESATVPATSEPQPHLLPQQHQRRPSRLGEESSVGAPEHQEALPIRR